MILSVDPTGQQGEVEESPEVESQRCLKSPSTLVIYKFMWSDRCQVPSYPPNILQTWALLFRDLVSSNVGMICSTKPLVLAPA